MLRRTSGVRILAALVLSGLCFLSPLGGAPSAVADHAPTHDPAARLQLVINSVYIIHDNDPSFLLGDGEIKLTSIVMRCVHYHLGQCDEPTDLIEDTASFSAGDKETVPLNRVLPAYGGFDLYDGGEYMLRIMALESDSVGADDNMGEWVYPLLKEENWHIGQHEYQAWGEYYDNGTRRHQGDFSVNYEIRPAPNADLHPTEIKILKLAGTTDDTVCVAFENIGTEPAGPFQVIVRKDDMELPNGRLDAGGLKAGSIGELCTQANLGLAAPLAAVVDEGRAVPEVNESNNTIEYQFRRPVTLTDPPPGSVKSDLVAKRLQVQGKEPSGQNDCDPGKNDVTVVVTNESAAPAGAFVVRLLVDDDDDDASLRTVTGLDGNKETEVTFAGVQLKKGERKLTVTVDAQMQVAESNENNNELKVAVRCKKEGEDDD